MAQIVFPNDFASQLTLLNDVIAKNTSFGGKSPLDAWLKEKNISLDAFQSAGVKAQTCEKQRLSYESLSQQGYQQRDELFAPVFTFIMQGAQSLKKWYKPTYALLKDWGIPVTATGRIDYPSSFEERSAIATSFFEKYASYGTDPNPLSAFVSVNEIDVPTLEENSNDAITNNTSGITNAKLSENATATRNKYWDKPEEGLRAIGEYLKSIYVNDPKALGEWGFVVDESEGKTSLRKSKVMLGATSTFSGIKLGSILTNIGKVNIIVYKGLITTGAGTTLQPGEMMGMLKGYSSITVINTSTLEIAEFTVEVNK